MQRQVALRRSGPKHLHFIQVEKDRRGAGDLQPDETPAHLAIREANFKRRRAADAPEMFSLVLVSQRPLLAILRRQNAQGVGIMQAGCVVEAVGYDHAAERDHLTQVHLPPGIGFLAGVKRVFAVLDAVTGSARVGLRRDRAGNPILNRFGLLQPVLLNLLAQDQAADRLIARLGRSGYRRQTRREKRRPESEQDRQDKPGARTWVGWQAHTDGVFY